MVRFNEKNEVISEEKYSGILIGLQTKENISYSMGELKGLAEAANIEVLGQMVQSLDKPNSRTLIGKGKLEELKKFVENMEIDTVIFNDELTGAQLRNIEDFLGVRIIDRTILILDIFAKRATSKEGKLQVELAQLKYRIPRLTGFGKSLSKQGGGIGTRGPGEKKLETDRRHIESRIDDIKKELSQIKQNRVVQKQKREKSSLPVVALVGYTNSGKSALMNRVLSYTDKMAKENLKEEKTVLEKNMLFATLDTAQRSVILDNSRKFILVDTVGFVSKLPHSLIDAFKATLEEVVNADLLIHVVDASYENHDFHIEVTNQVLNEVGAGNKEKIMAFNKIDLVEEEELLVPIKSMKNVYISAKYNVEIDTLMEDVKEVIFKDRRKCRLLIPYERGDISSYLCEQSEVISMEHEEKGTLFCVEIKREDYERLKGYEIL